MDVDGAPVQLRAQVVAEDLHVAREHDELDVESSTSSSSRASASGLVVRRHRQVVERDAVPLHERLVVAVVGHDGDDVDGQLADARSGTAGR